MVEVSRDSYNATRSLQSGRKAWICGIRAHLTLGVFAARCSRQPGPQGRCRAGTSLRQSAIRSAIHRICQVPIKARPAETFTRQEASKLDLFGTGLLARRWHGVFDILLQPKTSGPGSAVSPEPGSDASGQTVAISVSRSMVVTALQSLHAVSSTLRRIVRSQMNAGTTALSSALLWLSSLRT